MSAAVAGSLVEIAEGEEDWLFLRRYADLDVLDQQADLSDWVRTRLPKYAAEFAGRHARLAEREIPYILAIAPEKASIYPEKLPQGRRIAEPTAAQLLTGACRSAGLDVVDLTTVLRSAKGAIDLYCRVDSHWTYFGAYLAYRAILDEVRKTLPASALCPQRLVYTDKDGFGDLGVHVTPERRGRIQHVDCVNPAFRSVLQTYDQREHAFATHACDSGRGKVLVIRDSFTTFLAPYFSRSFAETIYVAPSLAVLDDMIDDLAPDVVIHQCAERSLFCEPHGLTDWPPRSWRQIYLEAREHPREADLVRAVRQALGEWRFDEAVVLARKLAEQSDGSLDHNLAEALVMCRAHAEALEACRRIEARCGGDAFVSFLKAHAELGLGNLGAALESLRKGLALRPGHARFLYMLGCWLSGGPDKTEAAAALRAAVTRAPAFVEGWEALARLLSQTGDTEAAARARREADRLKGAEDALRSLVAE